MKEIIKYIYFGLVFFIVAILFYGPFVIIKLDKKLKPWMKYTFIGLLVIYIIIRIGATILII